MQYLTDDTQEKPWMKLNCASITVAGAKYTYPIYFNALRSVPVDVENGSPFTGQVVNVLVESDGGGFADSEFTVPVGGRGLYQISFSATFNGTAPGASQVKLEVRLGASGGQQLAQLFETADVLNGQVFDVSVALNQIAVLDDTHVLGVAIINEGGFTVKLAKANWSVYRLFALP